MAAGIEKNLGVKPELEESSGGAFEVFRDGRKIFSKLSTGRFPTNDEIIRILKGT